MSSEENKTEVENAVSEQQDIPDSVFETIEASADQAEVEPPKEEVFTEELAEQKASPLKPNLNVSISRSIVDTFNHSATFASIPLLNITYSGFINNSERITSPTGAISKNDTKWAENIKYASANHYFHDEFTTITENGDWQQTLNYDGKAIGVMRSNVKPPEKGAELTGATANLAVRQKAKVGGSVTVPLWHSGIWVHLKTPSNKALLEHERSLAQAKTDLGRKTNGTIFSNEMVMNYVSTANFVLQHCFDSSLMDHSVENLAANISILDIPTLAWGMASAIYQNGFPLTRPCVDNPEKCHHVMQMMLNISKMLIVNNSAFTNEQKMHMANPKIKHKIEDIKKYQAAVIDRVGNNVIPFVEDMSIRLKIPSIAEYEDSGYRWIDAIVDMVDGAAGVPLEGALREQYIQDQAKLAKLRQYGHWIAEIIVDSENENVIKDVDDIEENISDMSSHNDWDVEDDHTTRIIDDILLFIEKCSLSIIAIPKYECPECGAEQTDEYSKHPQLIPVDAVRLFFTLRSLRLLINLSRQ